MVERFTPKPFASPHRVSSVTHRDATGNKSPHRVSKQLHTNKHQVGAFKSSSFPTPESRTSSVYLPPSLCIPLDHCSKEESSFHIQSVVVVASGLHPHLGVRKQNLPAERNPAFIRSNTPLSAPPVDLGPNIQEAEAAARKKEP